MNNLTAPLFETLIRFRRDRSRTRKLTETDILSVAIHIAMLKILFGTLIAGIFFVVILTFENVPTRFTLKYLT